MPVLEEIEAYFASQPEWQQPDYAALRSGSVVSAALCAELMALCIKGATAQKNTTTKPAVAAAPGTPQDNTSEVRFLGIEKVQHINRLAAAQSLKLLVKGYFRNMRRAGLQTRLETETQNLAVTD